MLDEVDRKLENAVYEAAVIPELWPNVLGQLASMTGSVGAVLFSNSETQSRWLAAPGMQGLADRFVVEGWPERNTRAINGFRKGLALLPRFLTEADFYEGDEYERDPLYTDYFYPVGLGWSAGTVFAMPHGDFITLSVERARQRGPIPGESLDMLDAVRPHLGRSAMMAARLSFERARTAVETLAALGLAAFAMTTGGRVLIANADFETEQASWTTRGGDRIVLRDGRANRSLYESLETIDGVNGVRSIALFGRQEEDRAVLHVIPVRRSAFDLFGHATAIAVLTKPSVAPTGAITLLQSLFDLTAAEARLAAQVAAGQTLNEIAAAEGKSLHTVRTRLKSVLDKTGCRRQADLARLLARLVPSAL
jgi:DNA-binding CsgD family transcriptional regulator